MRKIKIFALVEGGIVDKLSDRISGTFIRIHYILKYSKQKEDIELIYIPFQYKQKYSAYYSRINYLSDLFYHFAIPFLSWLIILFRRPDFVYFSYPNAVFNDKFNVPLLRFAKRTGARLLMYAHDWAEQLEIERRSTSEILRWEKCERELVKMSDILVVVLSKYPEFETAVLHGGFEPEEFANLRYRIYENRFNIAYIGAMSQGIGLDLLVDSAIMLHKKYPYIRLFLFGKYSETAMLDEETKNKIEQLEFITHQVVPRTKLISHFSDVDVFAYVANPNISYHNNTRRSKLFEYIGSEIPFIATQCVGLKVVSNGQGFLWVDYSADDFCQKLEYLLQNPQERMRLSKELHRLKRGNTWQNRADKLHDIIIDYLCKQERPKDAKT
ncbi:glycosyltransferase family 4 protein [Chloroflexota bacterium]